MNNHSVTFENIVPEEISMEMAGVSYIGDMYNYKPIFPNNPVVINLDMSLEDKSSKEKFNPSLIAWDNKFYYLKGDLKCEISSKDNMLMLACPVLNMKVWGKSREELIDAFNFNFHSLYENFAKEADNNLSPGAKKLSKKLKSLVV